jgi:uncharacterized protein YndB with AHSA1/START domain
MNDTDTNTNTSTSTGTDLGELTFIRVFDASPEVVFDCMTTPEHLARFWGPTGCSTPIDKIVVEPRVGGRFETTMVSDDTGEEYPMVAEFTAFDRPSTLGWSEPTDEPRMTTTVTFTDRGDGTTDVVIHQVNVPPEYRSPEAQAGLQTSFDRFDAYLATL